MSNGIIKARFRHGENHFVHLKSDFKDNVASIGFRSKLDEFQKGLRFISNTDILLASQSVHQAIGLRYFSENWKWRGLVHIEDKLSLSNVFSYQWCKCFNLMFQTKFVTSQMEFSERNVMLNYWLNDQVSLHYRSRIVPKYITSEHQLTAFVKKDNWKLVSGLVSCPKVASPYVLQAFKFKYSDELTFKGRATSLGQVDLATQVRLNENATLGISQSFKPKEIAQGKLDQSFGLLLRFHY